MWTKDNIQDLNGKTAVITGANTGVGYETAKILYSKGAHVILACRDLESGRLALNEIKKDEGNSGTIDLYQLDLSSLESVKIFADTIKNKYKELHFLINNAGIMSTPYQLTADGFESQFGVNFLGHFALTGHLYPLLKNSDGARVVSVTSLAYAFAQMNFEDLNAKNSYEPLTAYYQSKLALVLFTVEMQRRITLSGDQVLSVASHPGMSKSNLGRHMDPAVIASMIEAYGAQMETSQGALFSVYAAVSPEVKGGSLYGGDVDGGLRGAPAINPIQDNALDEAAAKKLWEAAEQYTGVTFL